jgi:tRNA U34 5-methylaminomethyl-2-thiouridine-forming methyltransferase MnmC
MNHRKTRPLIPIAGQSLAIQITDDGSRTVIDSGKQIAFHSASGAVSETRAVYLINSGMQSRLQRGQAATILEIGFGSGLAMLMTLDAALGGGAKLHYTAIEQTLLETDLLEQLELQRHVVNTDLVPRFLAWRQRLGSPAPRGSLVWDVNELQRIVIEHTNAENWVSSAVAAQTFDAIYFDPFAPQVNPSLWRPSFLQHLQTMLKPAGVFVTYCVSRAVREAMESVGFVVTRVPGPAGGKREVLVATKT